MSEIEELRAEIEQLRREWSGADRQAALLRAEIERLREHIAALQLVATAHEAEIERLRAALQEVRDLNDLMDPDIEDIARRALEPKPECAECKDGLPSLNWKNGKPYSYCPECGRHDQGTPRRAENKP